MNFVIVFFKWILIYDQLIYSQIYWNCKKLKIKKIKNNFKLINYLIKMNRKMKLKMMIFDKVIL